MNYEGRDGKMKWPFEGFIPDFETTEEQHKVQLVSGRHLLNTSTNSLLMSTEDLKQEKLNSMHTMSS
jgi:hypothetical protein